MTRRAYGHTFPRRWRSALRCAFGVACMPAMETPQTRGEKGTA